MLRFGILGAARIAPAAVIRPASMLANVKIAAIAASDSRNAELFAGEYGIPTVHSSYAELVTTPEIDAVYNALPPSLHEQWSIAALESGKHVLCEKPFAMNATQARRMVMAANASQKVLVEAFHYRFHPFFQRVLDLIANDVIGGIHHIEAQFDASIPYRSEEFRHNLALGGGALMDLGCYPVHWVRTLMGAEPQVVMAECVRSEVGVDVATRASLYFPGGATAEIMTAMDDTVAEQHYAHVVIEGEKGRLTLENPIAPHNGNKIIVESNGSTYSENIAGESTYYYQLCHFIAAVDGSEASITGGEDAINNMQLIDNIYSAAGFERPEFNRC